MDTFIIVIINIITVIAVVVVIINLFTKISSHSIQKIPHISMLSPSEGIKAHFSFPGFPILFFCVSSIQWHVFLLLYRQKIIAMNEEIFEERLERVNSIPFHQNDYEPLEINKKEQNSTEN